MDGSIKAAYYVFISFFFFSFFILIRDYFVSFAFKFHRKPASHRFTSVNFKQNFDWKWKCLLALVIYSWRDKIILLAFSSLYIALINSPINCRDKISAWTHIQLIVQIIIPFIYYSNFCILRNKNNFTFHSFRNSFLFIIRFSNTKLTLLSEELLILHPGDSVRIAKKSLVAIQINFPRLKLPVSRVVRAS